MTDDEAVAIAIALRGKCSAFAPRDDNGGSARSQSRWKVADRKPDLEIEELRAIH
jgi:hypothetical protein